MSDYTPTTFEVRSDYAYGRFHINSVFGPDDDVAAFDRWLADHDREVAAKAIRGFVEQLQTAESVLALKLDDILNGVAWMDSGDEVARWIISAITARGEIRAIEIEKGKE